MRPQPRSEGVSIFLYSHLPARFPSSHCKVWLCMLVPANAGPRIGTASTRKHRAVVLPPAHPPVIDSMSDNPRLIAPKHNGPQYLSIAKSNCEVV